ncbi:MAG: hypothetical protein ABW000_25555 [Actinoplanes sp.]
MHDAGGVNTIRGGAGDDYLDPGRGADVLDGGPGVDRSLYADRTASVFADLDDAYGDDEMCSAAAIGAGSGYGRWSGSICSARKSSPRRTSSPIRRAHSKPSRIIHTAPEVPIPVERPRKLIEIVGFCRSVVRVRNGIVSSA